MSVATPSANGAGVTRWPAAATPRTDCGTTLNAAQEELVIYLRTQLLLPLDDLLAVVREFIEPVMSRSALDRLLRRRGHSRLPVSDKALRIHKPFQGL